MSKVYYLNINKKNLGPFSKEDILNKISNGDLEENSLIYVKGSKNWDFLKNIDDFLEAIKGVEKNSIKRWYIHKNKENQGPYSITELISMIQKGIYDLDDYTWSKGLEKWIALRALDGINIKSESLLDETNVSKIIPAEYIIQKEEPKKIKDRIKKKHILMPELLFGLGLLIFALLKKNTEYSLYLFIGACFFLLFWTFINIVFKRKLKP